MRLACETTIQAWQASKQRELTLGRAGGGAFAGRTAWTQMTAVPLYDDTLFRLKELLNTECTGWISSNRGGFAARVMVTSTLGGWSCTSLLARS